jgi:hypothetical protein
VPIEEGIWKHFFADRARQRSRLITSENWLSAEGWRGPLHQADENLGVRDFIALIEFGMVVDTTMADLIKSMKCRKSLTAN